MDFTDDMSESVFPELSTKDIEKMHSCLLDTSLHDLCDDRTGAETLADIFTWINRPFSDTPDVFSYQLCCLFINANPYLLRNAVLEKYECVRVCRKPKH